MNKAREKLGQEINIVEVVKSWRYMERALNYLISKEMRLQMKEKARYVVIDPELKPEEAFTRR